MAPATRKPPTVRVRCGTVAGYTAHFRANERPCDECRIAHNANRRRSELVYDRAARRLRERYVVEFFEFVAEERAKVEAGVA